MSNDDIPNALLALNDLNKGWGFGERIFQGMVNTIALEQLLRGKLATELFVDGQGRSIVDPTRVYFLGVSLGHVLGATFFAYDPFITRGVLNVGGANWALMFERSNSWAAYGLPLKSTYDDAARRGDHGAGAPDGARGRRWRDGRGRRRSRARRAKQHPAADLARRRVGTEPRELLPRALARR